MIFYLDTSALVKYYVQEVGSQQVTELIQHPDSYLFISELTRIEVKSSLHTKLRTRQINTEKLASALMAFEVSLENFFLQEFTPTVGRQAESLLEQYAVSHALRAMDAIQFATFQQLTFPGITFICADERLHKLAVDSGCKTMNPGRG